MGILWNRLFNVSQTDDDGCSNGNSKHSKILRQPLPLNHGIGPNSRRFKKFYILGPFEFLLFFKNFRVHVVKLSSAPTRGRHLLNKRKLR